jgi:hypothetical protein
LAVRDWIDHDRWDVLAAAAADSPADAPWQAMLKTLLIERFKLRAHLESRERPIYRLVLARGDKRLGPDIRTTACRSGDLDCGKLSAATNGFKSGTITGVARTPPRSGPACPVCRTPRLRRHRPGRPLRFRAALGRGSVHFHGASGAVGAEAGTCGRPRGRPFH